MQVIQDTTTGSPTEATAGAGKTVLTFTWFRDLHRIHNGIISQN
jgi:hypothetical protein